MAEIKSTIDLIMERTKGLTLSPEEKERLEEEKKLRGAQTFAQRYLRGELSLEELSHKRDEVTSNAQRAMMKALVEGIRLGREEFNRAMDALGRWGGKAHRVQLQRVRDLAHSFGQALQKRRRKVKAELWEDLARKGVQGSAVEPHVEGSEKWDQTIEEVAREFTPRLEALREDLLAQI